MDLLRINTAGSVDNGKSTLIGRLLYDSNALTKEQEDYIHKKTQEKGHSSLDFSVLTDGLVAEREQGITIDVAHIYFSTKKRKFIIADSPGHIEFTRNMVTGASNSEVSIILIDARKGLLEQNHRHFFISQLLKIPNVIFCINKMDLVDYKEVFFNKIKDKITTMLFNFDDYNPNLFIIPINSLYGDNIVNESKNMNWYYGETLNTIIHKIFPEKKHSSTFRFDVQNVLHIQNEHFSDFRGYAGRILSGDLSIGDTIVSLPEKQKAIVTEIRQYTNTLDKAEKGDSIILRINNDIDISRGTLLVKEDKMPEPKKTITAKLVWLENSACASGDIFTLQINTRTTKCKLSKINYIIPPENPKNKIDAKGLRLNDIASLEIRLANPIFLDPYKENKKNGVFILINEKTNNTCAVGFVE